MNLPEAVVALDVGSTRLKAGAWRGPRGFDAVVSAEAPELRGEGAIRESDPEALLAAAGDLLEEASRGLARPVPLGLTTQRSSLVLWERAGGRAVTPMISWQDRRAAAWCERNAAMGSEIEHRTGLRWSPHYFAPKMALLCEEDAALARGLREGRFCAGTLDTFLLYRWSGGRAFLTDPTLAARTLLVDLGSAAWSPDLLRRFHLPREALGDILPSRGLRVAIGGAFELRALVSDQASAAVAALGARTGGVLINLGTGGFVLRPTGPTPQRRRGYLCGPYLSSPDQTFYALEGTINGIGPSVDAYGAQPTPWPVREPLQGALCLPDSSGVGSPYWLPRQGPCFSTGAEGLPPADLRRAVLEGIVFRVRQIVDDLVTDGGISTFYLSGGLTREPLLRAGLAALLPGEVRLLEERESALTGVASLAAGCPDAGPLPSARLVPDAEAGYLAATYEAWRAWVQRIAGSVS